MLRTLALLFSLSMIACGVDAPEGLCDPLADQRPAELRTFVAAGRAADGTIYVVDRAPDSATDDHVFVSDGEGIRRVLPAILGGGGSSEDELTGYGVELHAPPFSLVIAKSRTTQRLRMAVLLGDGGRPVFAIGEVGEELELLDEAEVRALPAYELEREMRFELAAHTPDGRTIAVAAPVDAAADDDRRVFFGKDVLEEREVLSFLRGEGNTRIELELGGPQPAVATFPGPSSTMPATLTIDGTTDWLNVFEAYEVQSEAFRCLDD